MMGFSEAEVSAVQAAASAPFPSIDALVSLVMSAPSICALVDHAS
jgi:hypothetical protein